MHTKSNQVRTTFLLIACILVVIGAIFVYSASSVYAQEIYGTAYYFIKRHLVGIVLGTLSLLAVQCFSLRGIKKLTPFLFFSSLALTALTLLPYFSQRIHGSSRWLKLGPLTFQPSELLKFSVILYLSYFLERQEKHRSSFIHGYLPAIALIILPSLILLKQPDFGLTVTILATTFMLLFVALFPLRHLLLSATALIPVIVGLIVMKPYRLHRILTFLDPWQDPHGAGFQIIQSLIAVGSGGIGGVGIANSKQKFFYLPMQHTDFIFSIIAEEIGFIGCAGIIILFGIFLYSGMRLAHQCSSLFSYLTIVGYTLLISLQGGINIAVSTGLLPTKGIGLPLMSYGNSSLVCTLAMIGIILRLSRHEST